MSVKLKVGQKVLTPQGKGWINSLDYIGSELYLVKNHNQTLQFYHVSEVQPLRKLEQFNSVHWVMFTCLGLGLLIYLVGCFTPHSWVIYTASIGTTLVITGGAMSLILFSINRK